MSANRYVPGFASTTARSSKRAKEFGFCPSFCPPKVPGSTPSSRSGCMPRRLLWNPMVCSRLSSWLNAFVLTLAAPMNPLFPLSKRLRDYALVGPAVSERLCSRGEVRSSGKMLRCHIQFMRQLPEACECDGRKDRLEGRNPGGPRTAAGDQVHQSLQFEHLGGATVPKGHHARPAAINLSLSIVNSDMKLLEFHQLSWPGHFSSPGCSS